MKNISFLSENFQFLEVKFSIYLNRRVFVMRSMYIKPHPPPDVLTLIKIFFCVCGKKKSTFCLVL